MWPIARRYFSISTQNVWDIIRCIGNLKIFSILLYHCFLPLLFTHNYTRTAHYECIPNIAGWYFWIFTQYLGYIKCSTGVYFLAADSACCWSTSNTKVASHESVNKCQFCFPRSGHKVLHICINNIWSYYVVLLSYSSHAVWLTRSSNTRRYNGKLSLPFLPFEALHHNTET